MKTDTEIRYASVEGNLKVGVISDSQLSPFANGKVNTFQLNLLRSFRTLKKLGCNAILFAGDICNAASKYAYRRYKNCFALAFEENPPLLLSVMGNHDYYGNLFARALFQRELGQNPFVHYVINGFHFIGASPDCCSMHSAYEKTGVWLDEQLKVATADSKDKPVFVVVHHPPSDTVYGSDDWGDKTLDKVLRKYENVVVFAGHSHYSLVDERSYYNGKYRVFNTQSVSYTELERGKVNGSVPPQAHVAPMGLVLDFASDEIKVLRYDLLSGEKQKSSSRWSIPYDCRIKTQKSYKESGALPVMPFDRAEWYEEDGATYLAFTEGADGDMVHSYRLIFDDDTVQDYFSEFYKGGKYVSKYGDRKVRLRLYDKKAGEYDIKIFAVNSYGQVSESYALAQDVRISERDKYKRKFAPDVIW